MITWSSTGASSIQFVMFVVNPGRLCCSTTKQTRRHCACDTDGAAEALTGKSVSCIVERYGSHMLDCSVAKQSRIGIVRRLPELPSLWRVRVAPPWIRHWWERVAPPELMDGSPRAVMTSMEPSQILEKIGTRAEVRTTSDSSAARETCMNQIWKRRYLSIKVPWIQEPRR